MILDTLSKNTEVEDQIKRDQIKQPNRDQEKSQFGWVQLDRAQTWNWVDKFQIGTIGGEQWSLLVLQTGTIRIRASPTIRIGITCTRHQKHRPRWRHRIQVLWGKETWTMEGNRPTWTNERIQLRRVGSFFKMQRNSHHIKHSASHTKKEQTTALQLASKLKKRFYPPTIAGFVLRLQTWFTPKASSRGGKKKRIKESGQLSE